MKKHFITLIFILILITSMNLRSQTFYSEPFAHTFSIVARDAVTGEMGVAVQSHWFSVGSIVSWGESGVGVVATQSFVNPSFGLRGLELLKAGKSPQEAVDELIASDEGRDVRQLAILDTKGRSASYTGKNCIPDAGNIAKENYSVQANMMLNNTVWPAMSEAFENSTGPLAERLITALEAGQNAGGDIRGKQSACLLIVKGEVTDKPWEDKMFDLRVDDSPEPIAELKRLLRVYRAYEHMNNGDVAVEKNNMELAMKEYSAAEEMFPDNLEMKFWHAVTLANIGKLDESIPMFEEVFSKDENWKLLFSRLPQVGLVNLNEEELNKVMNVK
ncbi:MAG: DUF1028 domain-containing protein [Ignavibacteriae bacterium]|nr:DUF1028 domain-containing protein [Ignavibacteriota bacterium]